MAENEELEVDESKKKGGGSKLIIIIAAVLLGISLGAASMFFFVGGSSETEEAANEEPQWVSSIYHRFEKPFIVTVLSEGKQRYLQVNVAVKTKQQEAIDAIVAHEPVIKSRLNDLFASQQLASLQTDTGRQSLNQTATTTVQDFLASKDESLLIEQVLFTDFVMQ
ncbi:MAG: flagellar basal body-associated FliL family protein [Pseudomonadales bacterium]|jgi:flagellar FliL protein